MNCLTLKTRVPIPTTAASIDVGNSSEILKGYMKFRKEEGLKLEDKINAILKEPIPLGMIKDGAIYNLGKYDSQLDKLEDWLNWMKLNRR